MRCPIPLPSNVAEVVARWRHPRRRARLPGRGRLRELARRPGAALRRAAPRRLRRVGRLGDDDRLIGLLMTRDEADVLDECLTAATRWFDRILVLDGTTDPDARAETDRILAAHPEVVHVVRDEEVATIAPITDGARQHLLDEARRRWGVDNWIGILHADECLDQDPRPMLAARHPTLDPSIRVRLVHTFLHTDDEADWPELARRPLRRRIRHLMWPGVPESRFFFDTGSRDYELERHGKVLPVSLRPGPLVDGFVITQYNERTPDQVITRARQRAGDDWQHRHYRRFLNDPPRVFTDTLDPPDAPLAREFAGDPEGPFRPLVLDEIPHGPDPSVPPPVIVADDDPDANPALGDRPTVDLSYVWQAGGLLDLVERHDRRAVARWSRRMRDLRPGRFGAAACADGVPPGYRALLRHTERVLASRRCSSLQRATVARELVHRLHDRSAAETGWAAHVPQTSIATALRTLLRHGEHRIHAA